MADQKDLAVPQSLDSELAARTTSEKHEPGDGYVPEDFREQDFLTRNGLNLKSFQRREFA